MFPGYLKAEAYKRMMYPEAVSKAMKEKYSL